MRWLIWRFGKRLRNQFVNGYGFFFIAQNIPVKIGYIKIGIINARVRLGQQVRRKRKIFDQLLPVVPGCDRAFAFADLVSGGIRVNVLRIATA